VQDGFLHDRREVPCMQHPEKHAARFCCVTELALRGVMIGVSAGYACAAACVGGCYGRPVCCLCLSLVLLLLTPSQDMLDTALVPSSMSLWLDLQLCVHVKDQVCLRVPCGRHGRLDVAVMDPRALCSELQLSEFLRRWQGSIHTHKQRHICCYFLGLLLALCRVLCGQLLLLQPTGRGPIVCAQATPSQWGAAAVHLATIAADRLTGLCAHSVPSATHLPAKHPFCVGSWGPSVRGSSRAWAAVCAQHRCCGRLTWQFVCLVLCMRMQWSYDGWWWVPEAGSACSWGAFTCH
jgi:hypothetical protein